MPAYIGVNGVAKQIFKVYQGNSEGKAELIFGPKGIKGFGRVATSIDPLCVARAPGAVISTEKYVGVWDGYRYKTTNYSSDTSNNYPMARDVYDISLTHVISEYISDSGGIEGLATALCCDRYYILGGNSKDDNGDIVYANTAESYDDDLIDGTTYNLGQLKTNMIGVSVGNYAIFAGGASGQYAVTPDAKVLACDGSTGTFTNIASLSDARHYMGGSTAGNGKYAMFAGGRNQYVGSSSYQNIVELYNTELTKTQGTAISQKVANPAVCTNGNHTIVMGGSLWSGHTGAVDVYDSNMTKTSLSNVTEGQRSKYRSVCLNGYMIFGCPGTYANYILNAIDIYDENLVHSSLQVDEDHYTTSDLYGVLGDYFFSIGGTHISRYPNEEYLNYDHVDAYSIYTLD